MKLSIRPFPRNQESVEGYKLRLAIANGWESFPKMIRATDIPHTEAILYPLTGHGQRLRLLGLPPEFKSVQLQDKTRLYQSLKLSHVRICPLCLAEGHTCKAEWDYLPFTHCIEHGVELIHSCCNCGSQIRMTSGLLENQCSCGASYNKSTNAIIKHEPWLTHYLSLCEKTRTAYLRDLFYAIQRAIRPYDAVFDQRRIPPRNIKSWAKIVRRAYKILTDEVTITNWVNDCFIQRSLTSSLGRKATLLPVTSLVNELKLDWKLASIVNDRPQYSEPKFSLSSLGPPDNPRRLLDNVDNNQDENLRYQVTLSNMSELMEVDSNSITRLFEADILQTHKPVKQIRYAYFDLRQLSRFIESIPSEVLTREMVSIRELQSTLPLFAAKWSDVFIPIFDRSIDVYRTGEIDAFLAHLMVRKGIMYNSLYHVLRKRSWDRMDNISQDGARKLLKIPRSAFNELARNGILVPMRWHTRNDRYRIKDIISVLLHYIPIGRWCEIYQFSDKDIQSKLSESGFAPLISTIYKKTPELIMLLRQIRQGANS